MTDEEQDLLTAAIEASTSDSMALAFEDMLAKGYPLSKSQRDWATAVIAGERYVPEEKYLNEWSAGRIPRGREVPLAPVLQNLPMKPPGRKSK